MVVLDYGRIGGLDGFNVRRHFGLGRRSLGSEYGQQGYEFLRLDHFGRLNVLVILQVFVVLVAVDAYAGLVAPRLRVQRFSLLQGFYVVCACGYFS